MGGTTAGLLFTRVSDCEVSPDESQVPAERILKLLRIWIVFPEQPHPGPVVLMILRHGVSDS